MFELLLLLQMLSTAGPQTPATLAQYQPCVWPNRCSEVPMQVAQYQPCVWPNRCLAKSDEKV